jgi:transketolase N-terminal domain/subunit
MCVVAIVDTNQKQKQGEEAKACRNGGQQQKVAFFFFKYSAR